MGGNLARTVTYLIGSALLLLCFTSCQASAKQIEESVTESEWESLKALYAATGGDRWKNNSGWIVNGEYPPRLDSLAKWYGVTLSNGRITELDLSDNGLTGFLPVELGDLSHLQVLDLGRNELSGSIGPWIKGLTALVKLRIQNNHLSGPLPNELGDLIHLEYLNLRGNQLQGVVPETLAKLPELRGIWLHANQLSGSISQGIVNLPKLGWLWLGENPDLSGVIQLSEARRMILINFYLGGTGLCVDRTNVKVDGSIEWEQRIAEYACLSTKEWDALERLYDSTDGDNWINRAGWNFGSRPRAEVVGEWHGVSVEDGHIRSLQLGLNQLDGFLPPELGSLAGLEVLRVDGNLLRGAIPEEVFLLEHLGVFSATETELCVPTTTSAHSWLDGATTVIGLGLCSESETVSPPDLSDIGQGQLASTARWLVVGIGLLGILGAGVVLITAIIKARRARESETDLVEIDKNAAQLIAIERRLGALTDAMQTMLILSQQHFDQSDTAKDFSSVLKSLRSALDERDQEIKRLRRGYDNAVFRKFIARFIRVDQAVQYFMKHAENSATDLESIHSLLEDALQECDVRAFSPEIGSDYRSAFGVTEYPKILPTSVPEDDCRIAEILEPGFVMQGGKEKEVLIPARVAIYRYKLS